MPSAVTSGADWLHCCTAGTTDVLQRGPTSSVVLGTAVAINWRSSGCMVGPRGHTPASELQIVKYHKKNRPAVVAMAPCDSLF